MSVPAPIQEEPTEDPSEKVVEQFYTAAASFSSSGNSALDTLLQKGLYGKRTPKQLRDKKAAEAFQQAFDLIGGVPRLALWADKNPDAFFSLYSKLIPSSVKAEVSGTIKIDAPWMNPNRLSYQNAQTVDVIAKEVPTDPQAPQGE